MPFYLLAVIEKHEKDFIQVKVVQCENSEIKSREKKTIKIIFVLRMF